MLKSICNVCIVYRLEKLGGPICLAMLWEMQLGRRGDVESSQELIQMGNIRHWDWQTGK